MSRSMGLLVQGFDYSRVAEDEFNDWLDSEYIPAHLRISGFVNAQRWVGVDNSKVTVTIYDLESPDVLKNDAYTTLAGASISPWSKRVIGKCQSICHFEAEQILPGQNAGVDDGSGLLLFAMNVKPEAEFEFNDWYNTEHVPRVVAVPGTLCGRRFRATGDRQKYVALYHLSTPDLPKCKAWEEAVHTPWTLKMRPQTSDHLRIVLRRYQRKT